MPPALEPGDVVVAISPSGPSSHVLGWRGLGFLAERYRVRFTRGVFAQEGYLAGSEARRVDELRSALEAPDVKAIVAMRGGVGASHLVRHLSFAALADRPRWLVGFSDVTALHVEATRAGVASIHGPNLTALGRGSARTREAFIAALERPLVPRAYPALETIAGGHAVGPLFGGNLTVLHACAAGGRLTIPRGCVLFLEDVTERPYRLDRALATLALGGHFDHVAGVVLGDFTDCDPGPDRVTAWTVLERAFASRGIPVARGLPVGHGLRNDPLVLGIRAELDARRERAELRLG